MCRPPGFGSCLFANRGLTATARIVTASGLKSSTAKAAQPLKAGLQTNLPSDYLRSLPRSVSCEAGCPARPV